MNLNPLPFPPPKPASIKRAIIPKHSSCRDTIAPNFSYLTSPAVSAFDSEINRINDATSFEDEMDLLRV